MTAEQNQSDSTFSELWKSAKGLQQSEQHLFQKAPGFQQEQKALWPLDVPCSIFLPNSAVVLKTSSLPTSMVDAGHRRTGWS